MIPPHPSLLIELEHLVFESGIEIPLGSFEALNYLTPEAHSIIEYLLSNPPLPGREQPCGLLPGQRAASSLSQASLHSAEQAAPRQEPMN